MGGLGRGWGGQDRIRPRFRTGLLAAVTALATAAALAGCGGKTDSRTPLPQGNRVKGDELTIYVSVPKFGPSAAAGKSVLHGAELALAGQKQIGPYRIHLKSLNSANPRTGQWSAALTAQNAQTAAAAPHTIGYLGDFNSGASAISIPIMNRLAIPQVSATSTAVGLTSDGPGSSPGSSRSTTTRRRA